ncbi:MAG: ATP-binding cassette domain-containing protein [Candidatus Magnetoovum sp. WYHC-5]|nr:ATP-binding cassette domain-containing protein [Candidatus Magnetoovum sp. WYHC-5]
MMEKQILIEIRDVKKTLNGHAVLNGVNLTIYKGDLIAIVGASGGGKSVLMKNVIGLMKPDYGQIIIDGKNTVNMSHRQYLKIIERFGVLFQSGALFDSINVYENIAFPLRERTKLKEKDIKLKIEDVLASVGLKGMDNKYPAELSGGMRKRAALARAIVLNPDVVFFDEPTTGLDPILMNAIHGLIKENHHQYGYTGIIISHEIPKIFSVANKVAMLHDGLIIAYGTPEEIQNSENPHVRNFLYNQ